ncbi:hypothetical protein Ahy_A05g022671 [Arachis hypogaea]|uniref:DUF4283 domain-containing protein n=1 Tax=Arachis hypogaea TaxID=3818 RepID=A0A445D1A7_ARAHY|nr:hypothetical protein Ahy_A05g022671 [Arachis hypogaea]
MVTGVNQELEGYLLETDEDEDDKMKNDQEINIKLHIIVEDTGEGLLNIVIHEEVNKKLWKSWWRSLIVKLLEKRIGYIAMKRRIEAMWSRLGELKVIDLDNKFYLISLFLKVFGRKSLSNNETLRA